MDDVHGISIEEGNEDFSSDSYFDNSSSSDNDCTPTKQSGCCPEKSDLCQPNDARSSDNMFHNVVEDNYALDEYWDIIQMNFQSEDEWFKFYNSYARRKGFSVRRDIVRRGKKDGHIQFRRYVCCKQGIRDPRASANKERVRRQRALTRMNCPAKLCVKHDKQRGVWFVANFVDEHNHPLTSHDETPFLWSHRKMKDFQKSEIVSMESHGIWKNMIMRVLNCKYGGYDKVGFVKKDLYNFSSRYKRSRILDGDANAALDIMKERREKDPDFFYDYQVDAEGRLKDLFWCDAQSRMDYQSFGDVVVFDSTQRMNKYNMPFIPFVGMNHHRQTTIFACGITSDECVESYKWLLLVFLRAMCQQKPRSIITDSDNAMMKAIRQVLPDTDHRVCSWHIERGITKHLHFSYLQQFMVFIYDACSHDEFEVKWNEFVSKYQTTRNQGWLQRMYTKKKLWAAAFLADKYFLGIKSNQRSESLNACLHRHLDYYMTLLDLVEHYEVCVSDMRQREAQFDSIATHSWPTTITDCRDLEESVGKTFTFANFDLVQKELQKIDDLNVEGVHDGKCLRYKVSSMGKTVKDFYVDHSRNELAYVTKCSCRKMEREGIPCKHILRVLKHLEVREIPNCCVLQRFSKNAKGGLPSIRKSDFHLWTEKQVRPQQLTALGSELFDLASNSDDGFEEVKEYMVSQLAKRRSSPQNVTQSHADNEGLNYRRPEGSVLDPTCVATKGAPKRLKTWDERRPRFCSRCCQPGHDIRRCPLVKHDEQ